MMQALHDVNGNAIPETALCEDDLELGKMNALVAADDIYTWDGEDEFRNVPQELAERDQLRCQVCGAQS